MLPWALRVAATLRLADLMTEGLSRPEQLAARSDAHAGSLERLLRHLMCRGWFAEPEPGRFTLDGQAETLLSTVDSVADVGGGTGGLLAALLGSHPHLRGTLVDQKVTAERALQALGAANLTGRCEVIAGDFFAPLPRGRHVYVLRNILHDWNDEHATAILRNCRQAAGPHGRILVVELVMGDEATLAAATAHDLFMLLVFDGRERDLAQFARLATGAGLCLATSRALASGSWLLELHPEIEAREAR